MCPRELPRRTVLRTGAMVGLLGGLAGCQGLPGDDGGSSDGEETTRVDAVPAGADVVTHVDVTALLEDPGLREEMNVLLSQGTGPGTVGEALDEAEEQLGLDPRGLREVLTFGVFEGPSPNGGVLWSDWSQSDLFEALRDQNGGLSETTYNGTTILTDDSGPGPASTLGVLGEGVFAIGGAGTVESSIDRWQGDAEALSGDVRDAYTATQGGYARFGFALPAGAVPEETGGPLDAGVLRDLTYGYGSLTEGKTLVVTLRAEGSDAAEDVASVVESGLALARQEMASAPESEQRERVQRILDSTSVEQQDETVVVRTEDGGETVILVGGAVATSFVLGLGSQRGPAIPQVALSFEYGVETRELEITHDGGDAVPATELFVRAENAPTGRWDELGGSASGDRGGDPAVVAGDRLILSDVGAEYEATVVWEASDGTASATLGQDTGPEA